VVVVSWAEQPDCVVGGQSQAPDGHETLAEIQVGQRENQHKSTTHTHQDGMAGGLAGIHGRLQVNFMASGHGQVSNKTFHVTKEFQLAKHFDVYLQYE